MGQGESDEMDKRSVLSLYLRAEADALCPHMTPAHAALQGANSKRNIRKKNSCKRRNRRESDSVYLPWPLTLQTRASSTAPVLGQTCVVRALPVANTGVDVRHENRKPMGNVEEEKISVLTKTCKAPTGALLPATSPYQPSSERDALADNGKIKVGQNSSHKGRNQKDKKIVASLWPLTVQAWASFIGPAQILKPFAGASPSAIDEVNMGHGSRGQKSETDKRSIVLCIRGPSLMPQD